MNPLPLLLAAAPIVSAGPGDAPGDIVVKWKKKDVTLADIAPLGPSPATAAQTWAPFAEEHDYRMTLTDDGRVLLLTPRKKSTSKELKLIDKTCEYVDEILPSPEPADAAPATPPTPPPAPPDDGGEPGDDEAEWHFEYQWGAGEWRRDAETIVLVQASDMDDYIHAIELLAERFEYLRSWIDSARSFAGCTLQQPLAAIWLLGDKDLEEWDPENELVHRLTELLVLRRFDRQPAWLLQGLAWHVEYELQKSHYCFPWRSAFVFETEHTAWEAMLKAAHKGESELRMDDVCKLSRGDFQLDHARDAWGAAWFLVRYHDEALPTLLEDLRKLQREKGVVTHADGSWEKIPGYEPSAADQLALLQKAAGEEALADLLGFYQRGKSFKPKR